MTKIKNKTTGEWEDVANLSASDVIRNPDWSRAVSYTANNLNGGITAPEDGLFIGYYISAASSVNVVLTVNGVVVSNAVWEAGNWRSDGSFQVPVNKGDIIRAMNVINNDVSCSFVPYKVDVVDNRFPTNYSTQEQFTGKYWIDGKKIYRRVLEFNLPNVDGVNKILNYKGTSTPIKCSDWDADYIVDMTRGTIDCRNAQYTFIKRPLNYSISTADFCNVIFHENAELRVWFAGAHNHNADCTLIVEYTKTTD